MLNPRLSHDSTAPSDKPMLTTNPSLSRITYSSLLIKHQKLNKKTQTRVQPATYNTQADPYLDIYLKGGLTTRFDPPPNGLRELKLHRLSTNVCTKTKMFLKIFFDLRFRSEGA